MKTLVINSGSSSIKYQLFDLPAGRVLTHGRVERIGEANSCLTHCYPDEQGAMQEITRTTALPDHEQAFHLIGSVLQAGEGGSPRLEPEAIGHRVVHGGERFKAPTLIDAQVVATIREMSALAPLHNPANLTGIEAALRLFPEVPQVAVFDTAFHQSMPAHAYRYPLPEAWYRQYGVRRYGFHGTSHLYVAKQAAVRLQQPLHTLNLITLHLGNGASAAALRAGRCVDTSMGLTPLEGLMMGTRCGDIDPAILFYMGREAAASIDGLEESLNRDSGLKGICGVNDMREAEDLAEGGDERARLAIDMYAYRLRKYIGAYYAVLGKVDALVFTAGIGENSVVIRQLACEGLESLGISVDPGRNARDTRAVREIQAERGAVKVLVVPTNEEIEIAHETLECVEANAAGW